MDGVRFEKEGLGVWGVGVGVGESFSSFGRLAMCRCDRALASADSRKLEKLSLLSLCETMLRCYSGCTLFTV